VARDRRRHSRSVLTLAEATDQPAVPDNSVPVHSDETGSLPDTFAIFQMLYDTFNRLGGELRSEQRRSFTLREPLLASPAEEHPVLVVIAIPAIHLQVVFSGLSMIGATAVLAA
jgi:hypothetical protein